MKRCLLFAVMVILNAAMISAQNLGTIVFQKGENGFDTYRIPAMVHAQDGSILAFAEARKFSRSDTGDIDLVLKRSTDGGKTWGEIITVWDDGGNVCGNPSPVVVSRTGRIVLLSTWNHGEDHTGAIRERTGKDTRRVYSMYSDDHGLTWSAPVEITSSVKLDEWTWYATGPCHALETSSGRLVVPCNHGISIDGKPAGSHSHVIYSDDFGKTWNVLGGVETAPVQAEANEAKVEELPGGDIIITSRTDAEGRNLNVFTFKNIRKATGTWGQMAHSSSHNDGIVTEKNSCNGELLSVPVIRSSDGRRMHLLLQSVPSGPKRSNVGIYYKGVCEQKEYSPQALAADWEGFFRVTSIGSAYSVMALQKNGKVGFMFEEKTYYPTSGAGYTIVYDAFTIEEITGGAYTLNQK